MSGRRWLLIGALSAAAAPAYAAGAGQPCGLNATGVLDNHLGHETGELHGGPWVVTDGADVTLTCELEYGNAECYDTAGGFLTVTSVPRPHVGLLPPVPVEFWNPYQRPIFLGTTITWTYADGSPGIRHVDFDAAKPGDQCAVYTWGNEG